MDPWRELRELAKAVIEYEDALVLMDSITAEASLTAVLTARHRMLAKARQHAPEKELNARSNRGDTEPNRN